MNRAARMMVSALVFLSTASTAARAEVLPRFGVLAGATLSRFTGEVVEGLDARWGVSGGGFVNLEFSDFFALEPQVLFVMKGAKSTSQGTDAAGNPTGPFETTWALDYIEVPVLAKLKAPLHAGSMITLHLLFGPTFAGKLSGKLKENDPTTGSMSSNLQYVAGAEVGAAMGAGIDVGKGKAKWGLGFRYTRGLSGVFKNDAPFPIHSETFLLTLGRSF